MRKAILLGLLVLLSASCWAQDKVFDWVRASDEFAQLYPADYHAGRVYRPGITAGKCMVKMRPRHPARSRSHSGEKGMRGKSNPKKFPIWDSVACRKTLS